MSFLRNMSRRHRDEKGVKAYYARSFRVGHTHLVDRAPELLSLSGKTVVVVGLGCIGAPSALEFARAGVGELRVLDHDVVDPAASVRWPFGFPDAGRLKVEVLDRFVREHYPYTKPVPIRHKLGALRPPNERPEWEVTEELLAGASLLYDASAEWGVHHYLSQQARAHNVPYVMVAARQGGWGGVILRDLPEPGQGCWGCYCHHLAEGSIDEPPFDPVGTVQPVGCADPTFTGANFDIMQVALGGVRLAIATLCRGAPGGYPDFDWDVAVISLRERSGNPVAPHWRTYRLRQHVQCATCAG